MCSALSTGSSTAEPAAGSTGVAVGGAGATTWPTSGVGPTMMSPFTVEAPWTVTAPALTALVRRATSSSVETAVPEIVMA